MSATPEKTLADPERLIAELRRQLAECKAERDEALEQQTAAAEVLQVINSSPGDLTPVFDAILEKAHRLCETDFGGLQLQDGGKFRSVAERGLADSLAELLRRPFEPVPGSPPARLLRGERIVHIADMAELAQQGRDAARAQAAAEHGFRTGLFVPLRKDADLLGYIVAVRREVRLYSEKEIALLENFAAQAVIAMENARLLDELRQGTEELTRRQAALRNSEERYALAMRAINEGVYEWDVATSEMYYSPRVCELVGLQASELRTMTDWTDRIHPDDRQPFKKAILAHFKGETDRLEAEYRYRHADGSWHWARQHGIALKNEAGRAYRVVGSTGNITDRKAAEQALQEALEQQTATAEVLQVINSSPGDLTPVFNAMLERALRVSESAFGFIATYHGEHFHTAAERGLPPAFAEILATPYRPPPGAPAQRLLDGESFVQIADLREDEGTVRGLTPVRRAMVEAADGRSFLTVPLRREGVLVGVIVIYRREVRPFTDKQIALLQNFAAQAVIAMENARLLAETREALEQQTATAEVLQVINSSPGDLAPVFDAILEKAHSLCGADHGSLFLQDGEIFRAIASRGMPEAMIGPLREGIRANDSSLAQPLMAGEPFVHVHDSALD